jgi:hypothetical protein
MCETSKALLRDWSNMDAPRGPRLPVAITDNPGARAPLAVGEMRDVR